MEDCVLTIGFSLESTEVTGHYELKSMVPIFRGFDDELSVIGQQLVCFLKQVGYAHMNNDYLYMESITADEYEAIDKFLNGLREKQKKCEDCS